MKVTYYKSGLNKGKVKSFTISRTRWIRGHEENSKLRNEKGQMCCLGHCAIAFGFKPYEILERGCPDDVDIKLLENHPDYLELFVKTTPYISNTLFASSLMSTNDDSSISAKEREEKIVSKFKEVGIEVIFTG